MFERKHYNTSCLSSADRLAAWQDYMSTVYYSLEIEPMNADRIRGELFETQFASVGVSNFKADAQKVTRQNAAAQRDRSENFVFLFPTRQTLAFEQNGRRGVVRPGNVALLNSAEGYTVIVPDLSENITLKISCDLLRPRIPLLDDACGKLHVANPILVPVVRQLGEQLLKFDSGAAAVKLEQTLLDLVCVMMESRSADEIRTSGYRPLIGIMYDRIHGYMSKNFHDPNLTPARTAEAHRISLRYLHRVFQSQGATFGEVLMEMRLSEASKLLRNGAGKLPIGEIAYRCGFISQSHFSARFRQQFGSTPRSFGAPDS